jgi:hypothetical protein
MLTGAIYASIYRAYIAVVAVVRVLTSPGVFVHAAPRKVASIVRCIIIIIAIHIIGTAIRAQIFNASIYRAGVIIDALRGRIACAIYAVRNGCEHASTFRQTSIRCAAVVVITSPNLEQTPLDVTTHTARVETGT